MGVKVFGLEAPIIRQGDNIAQLVVNALKAYELHNKDVIGITESVVARAQGNYVTIDEINQFISEKNFGKRLILYSPIMSRNRFSIILKAFARYAEEILILLEGKQDEQGNPNYGKNMFTGVNIQEYYKEICEDEQCKLEFWTASDFWGGYVMTPGDTFIDCRCHPDKDSKHTTLKDIMNLPVHTTVDGSIKVSGWNPEFGLLGSNKADEEVLKLFPRDGKEFCNYIADAIKEAYQVDVEIMIFGDGCFKDPIGGIWEFADPVTCPGYTEGLEGVPNEIKVKYLADSKFKDLNGEDLERAIDVEIESMEENSLIGYMHSQGTTPRRYVDLLASLMDLTTGSGSRRTPFVLVQNYFK